MRLDQIKKAVENSEAEATANDADIARKALSVIEESHAAEARRAISGMSEVLRREADRSRQQVAKAIGNMGSMVSPAPAHASIIVPRTVPSQAQLLFENLLERVDAFQSSLDEQTSALAIYVTKDGDRMQVFNIEYDAPNLIVFNGVDSNGYKMMQSVSAGTAELTLKAIPNAMPDEKPRRIGFRAIARRESGEEEEG